MRSNEILNTYKEFSLARENKSFSFRLNILHTYYEKEYMPLSLTKECPSQAFCHLITDLYMVCNHKNVLYISPWIH